jgi:hypothetical protein
MSFDMAVSAIKNESFSSNKMNVAKQFIGGRWMTSQQVKEIIKLFSFGNDRLEVAKFAYGYVVDPANYFVINEALTFSSEKDELNKFILQNRRFY